MRLKILHPVPGFSYFGGETADVPDSTGAMLVAKGHALMIPETEHMQPITPIKAYVREDETVKTTVRRKRK